MPGITREAGQQEEIAPRPVRLMQLGMACKAKRTRRIGSAKLPNKQKPELTKSPPLYSKDPSLRVSSFQPQCVKAWNLAASECTVPVPNEKQCICPLDESGFQAPYDSEFRVWVLVLPND